MDKKRKPKRRLTLSQKLDQHDIFEFKYFGRYQMSLSCFVFCTVLLCDWNLYERSFTNVHDLASCVSPENVTDYCSAECEKIEFTNGFVKHNYITYFRWICGDGWKIYFLKFCDFCATICGVVCWVHLSNKYGRRKTLTWSLSIDFASDLIFLTLRNQYIYLITQCMHRFAATGYSCLARVLLANITPFKNLNLLIFISGLGYVGTSLLRTTLCVFAKHFLLMQATKSLITMILLIVSFFLYESHLWHFLNDDTENTIQVIEKIRMFNHIPAWQIREKVEKAWRETRSLPKNKETFLNALTYTLMRTLIIKVIILKTILTIGQLVPLIHPNNKFIIPDIFVRSYTHGFEMLLVCITWFYLSKVSKSKEVIQIGSFIQIFGLYTLLSLPEGYSLYFLGFVIQFIGVTASSSVSLYILELFPLCIRTHTFMMMFFSLYLGASISKIVFYFQKIPWFPFFLAIVCHIIAFCFSIHLADSSVLPQRTSIRETEEFLRGAHHTPSEEHPKSSKIYQESHTLPPVTQFV